MFEDFKPSDYKDWVTQANKETQKVGAINFPFYFNLDGLSLPAINTTDHFGNIPKLAHNVKYTPPVNSICLSGAVPDTNWQQLGVEDVILDFTQSNFQKTIKLQQLNSLDSIGVFYHPDNLERISKFWNTEKTDSTPRITFYPTILTNQIFSDKPEFPNYEKLAGFINQSDQSASFKFLGIRGDEFMNQGTNASQELGFTLSLVAHHWDKLTELELNKELLLNHTEIVLGLSGEFFIDLVKMRAARNLLRTIYDAFEIPNSDSAVITIRAVSGLLNKTLFDPDENLLRLTTEALASTLGGADIISLRTHDLHYQNKSSFGRRMAANVLNLIRHESHLHRVVNQVDGSYFLENATSQLMDAAWQTFLEIEEVGGIESYLDGKGEKLFTHSRDQKQQQFFQQQRKRVGVTRYINKEEKIRRSVVDSAFRTYSLTNQWEEIRLKANNLQPEEVPQAIIVTPDEEDNAIVSARITFVNDLLNSLGVNHQIFNASEFREDKSIPAALTILCASDKWHQLHLTDFLSSSNFTETPVFVAGLANEAFLTMERKKIRGVLNAESDLGPLLYTVQQLINHEA